MACGLTDQSSPEPSASSSPRRTQHRAVSARAERTFARRSGSLCRRLRSPGTKYRSQQNVLLLDDQLFLATAIPAYIIFSWFFIDLSTVLAGS